MKLFKKIISSVCALGMLSTLAVFNVNAADTVGLISVDVEYDQETGLGTATISATDVASILALGYGSIDGFANTVVLDDEAFDVSYYNDEPYEGDDSYKNYEWYMLPSEDWGGTFTPGKYGGRDPEGFMVSCTSMTDGERRPGPIDYDFKIYSFDFKVLDTTVDNYITIKDAYFTLKDGGTFRNFGDANYIGNAADIPEHLALQGHTIDGTGGGDITITIPGSGGSNTSEGVAIDPEKIGAEGENGVFTTSDPDFEGDKAVAKLANVTANNEGVMVWNVTGTRAAGGEENVNMDFEIPNTEGEVSVGLIVGYNEADWSSVVINSVTTQAQ